MMRQRPRAVTLEEARRIIERSGRIFNDIDRIKREWPLVERRWRFLRKGEYYPGRARSGHFIKIPNDVPLKLRFLDGCRTVRIAHKRQKTDALMVEDERKPVPYESRAHEYDIFDAVRSRKHIAEGHEMEIEQLKTLLKILVILLESRYYDRQALTEVDFEEMKGMVGAVLEKCEGYEAAPKVFGTFKLSDVPGLLEEAKGNLSRLSIAFAKMASAMHRFEKRRPEEMRRIDLYNYKQECVLRYVRDAVLKEMLGNLAAAVSDGKGEGNGVIRLMQSEYKITGMLKNALALLGAPGRKEWDGIRGSIEAVKHRLEQESVLNWRRGSAEISIALGGALALSHTGDKNGRTAAVRGELEGALWGIESGRPWHLEMQLRKTGDMYMERGKHGIALLLNVATDRILAGRQKEAAEALRAAETRIRGKMLKDIDLHSLNYVSMFIR